MDLEYGPQYESFRAEVRKFLEQHRDAKPSESLIDVPVAERSRWLSLLIDHGYWARTIPREYDGFGAAPDLLETVIMDEEFNQYDVEKENMESALPYLEDGLACELTFYEGKAISVELPTTVVREVAYTEPAVKGDTSGKVTKPAKLASGFEVQVPLFVNTGDKIEIDTRTGEYRRRV